MPFFTLAHVRRALDYMGEHTHPSLMSLLAMLRSGVPASDDPAKAVPFGSTVERRLMEDYFRPVGSPEDRPYFLPFGSGGGYSRWRDSNYAGKSLQRQRGERKQVFRQDTSDNKRWTLASDFADQIRKTPEAIVGTIPVEAAYLAVWCYRKLDIASVEAAVAIFVKEFRLSQAGVIGNLFSDGVPSDLSPFPLSEEPIDDAELLDVLQAMEPERPEAEPEKGKPEETEGVTAPASGAVRRAPPPPGDWNIGLSELGDLCGLEGLTEPATRTIAALAAGMHVILTGPPGTGKTKLAECICAKAGFPAWTVPATDQWTTFETIGGYFPTPQDGGSSDRLDFLPGSVVDSLENGRCLIIDEINRADIDKAFGELFTLLSGNSVMLPYRRRSNEGKFRRVRLQVGPTVVTGEDIDVIVVPQWWRIIGSMNDADKASLKRLSMAFIRRFAFIPVDLPAPAIYTDMLKRASEATESFKSSRGEMARMTSVLVNLFVREAGGLAAIGLPLGPAFPLSAIRHADSEWRLDPTRTFEAVLSSALELYVMPQFQGRPELHEGAVNLLQPLVPNAAADFTRHLAVWTGYVP